MFVLSEKQQALGIWLYKDIGQCNVRRRMGGAPAPDETRALNWAPRIISVGLAKAIIMV